MGFGTISVRIDYCFVYSSPSVPISDNVRAVPVMKSWHGTSLLLVVVYEI